ncbi:uncharacterized protein LOC134695391 [Mytilus trossulus]|uniref:uncharacterized protein LOC134695391 n=1 Tax=Mytilus trossulus TaxID=6551 RepID=UPI0030054196
MALQHQGKKFKVHTKFEDIMSLNYDPNQFVQKKEIDNEIVYSFKFRGEDVDLTLSPDAPYGSLQVDGKGGDTWWNEAHSILDKQCERLQSRKLKLPGAETGEKKKPLVSKEEFHDCFAHPHAYGTNPSSWRNETTLLYKYSSNATTKYWDIPEHTWKKIFNLGDKHAELIMKEDLLNIQDYLTIQPDDYEGGYKVILSVEVILSYSPCDKCAQALCQLKEKMDEKVKQRNEKGEQSKTRNKGTNTEIEEVEKNKFKITFSNFYKHLELYQNEHMKGLKDLLKSDIKLDVFTRDNWDYFFTAAGLVTERPRRRRREKDDKKILQYLEDLVAFDRMQEALDTTKLDMKNQKLL